MVSISKPQSFSQAKGYLEKENYYQKNSEIGYFYGDGLEYLGMDNKSVVTPETYTSMLDGFNPLTGEKIVKNAGNENRRAGIDVTFSAPKSVSVLMEFHEANGDEKEGAKLREAHEKAVLKSMNLLEKKYAKTRVYNDKKEQIRVDAKMMFASFEHDTSREALGQIDPQLHTHNFIFSTVFYKNKATGKVENKALTNEEIYQNKMFLGQHYRSELAKNLKDLGLNIEVTDRAKGLFEIDGFSQNQLEEFSSRSKLITDLIPKYREKYPSLDEQKLLEIIKSDTKGSKKTIDRDAVKSINLERAKSVGIDKDFVANLSHNLSDEKIDYKKIIDTHIDKALHTLIENNSVFKEEDLLKEVLKYGLEYPINNAMAKEYISQRKDILQLDKNVFSTIDMIKAEKNIILATHQGRRNGLQLETDIQSVHDFIDKNYSTMTQGQRDMTEFILNNKDQFLAIQGDAGTGKTYSAKAIKEYINAKSPEQEIIGLAFTGRASSGLEADSGIKSSTIHSFLSKEKKRKESNKPRVIIVDEAGMIGSFQMNEIIEVAKKNGDKVVFMGDTKQFESVNAGRAFKDMQKFGMKTVYLDEVKRQETQHSTDAIEALKAQKIDKSFSTIEEQKKLFEEDRDVQISKIAEDYAKNYKKDIKDTLILTSTNKDRKELNDVIRDKLGVANGSKYIINEKVSLNGIKANYAEGYELDNMVAIQGKIKGFKNGQHLKIVGYADDKTIIVKDGKRGKEKKLNVYEHGSQLEVYKEVSKQFAKGDLITFTKNITLDAKTRENVKNGDRAYIKSIDKKGNVETENGKKFNINEMNYIDYGYAVTDVKSQGATVKNVVIMANSAMANFNSFYTQLTRAKRDITLYTDNVDQLKANIENTKEKKSTLDYTLKIKGDKDHDSIRGTVRGDDERIKRYKSTHARNTEGSTPNEVEYARDGKRDVKRVPGSSTELGTRNKIIQSINEFIATYGNTKLKLSLEKNKEIYDAIRGKIASNTKRKRRDRSTYGRTSREQYSSTNATRGKRTRKRSMYGLSVSNVVSYSRQATGMLLPSNAHLDMGKRLKISNLTMRGQRKLNTSKVRGSGDGRIDKLIQDVKAREKADKKRIWER